MTGVLEANLVRRKRRGQAETDAIKKARIANFLKEYWDISHGGSRRQNGNLKSIEDVSKVLGENKRSTERILKLNDLIPEIQELAYLPQEKS